MLSGTPSASVVLDPKLEVMSLRTMPLSVSTFAPLEPSPGYGPAVSSGISPSAVSLVWVSPPRRGLADRLSGLAFRRAGPERDQTVTGKSDAGYQLEHAAPVQQPWQIVVEAAIMVLQVCLLGGRSAS